MAALADPARTRLVLVARAQESSLAEVARTHEELARIGMTEQHLVVNGLMPAGEDPLVAVVRAREQAGPGVILVGSGCRHMSRGPLA